MKIAVIGAGAIGSTIAVYLKRALKDVVLVAKKEQAAFINEKGITVNGGTESGTFAVRALSQLDQDYDLVIFATKTQDLEEAYQHNNKFLDNGLILTSQNGVQADSILGLHIEKERLLSSIVMFGSTYLDPGQITINFDGDWIIGRPYLPVNPAVHEVAADLGAAFQVKVSQNITGMKYCKLFVNFNNCIPALTGQSMQETYADMDLCRLSIRLLKEGLDIVRKANIVMTDLPSFPVERFYGLAQMPEDQAAGIINKTLTGLSKEPLYGSILQSILRKRRSEIDFINGEVVCLAHQMRQEAELNNKMVELVHQVERTGTFMDKNKVKEEFGLIG